MEFAIRINRQKTLQATAEVHFFLYKTKSQNSANPIVNYYGS